MTGASIETTLELWACSLRDVKGRMRGLFTQERVAAGVAGLVFVFAAHIDWGPAGILAATSIVGGQLGARYGRRLPEAGLRAVIIAVGLFAIVRLLTG